MRAPIQWFDEFGFLKYNMIIYDSSSPAASQASEEAEKAGKPHCTMISTTPGSLETDYGKDAFEFKNLSLIFKEEFYDWDISDVKELIRRSSSNGFVNIIFSWRQLGRSNEYYEKMRQQLHENWFKIRREVLLQWISIRDKSPFEDDDLMKLQDMTYTEDDVYKTIWVDKYYPIKLYEKPDPMVTVIISSDVASGSSRDYSTIVITDSKTKRAIGEFRNNKIDTLQFSKIIYALATDVFPNSMVLVERNNVGHAVLSNLARTSVRSRLYYELTSKDETTEKIRNGREKIDDNDNRRFGIWTDDTKREQMMELLLMIVHKYKERIRLPILSMEIQGLEYNKKGRIDHTAECTLAVNLINCGESYKVYITKSI